MAEWTPGDDGKALVYESLAAATVLRPVVTREATTVASSTDELTIDVSQCAVADVTLDEDCTVTLSGARSGQAFTVTLVLRQDSTGSWEVTWPAGTIWPGGTEPTLSTAAGSVDIVSLTTLDGGTEWLGVEVGLDFS